MAALKLRQARAVWARAQGLGPRASESPAATCKRTGWIRSLGGVTVYLALAARAKGTDVRKVHAALKRGSIAIRPAVRGCIYVVPKADVALSLRTAALLSEKRNARDAEKAGIRDGELDDVAAAVLEALRSGPASTPELRKALPSGAIRSLGDRGKKVGVTSTLPPALRQLEFAGAIERRLVDDRLDHERYIWAVPSAAIDLSAWEEPAAVHLALAKRFFLWAGPASLDAFAGWSGFGKTVCKKAVEAAKLAPVDVDGEAMFCAPENLADDAPVTRAALLPALDNLYALRGATAPLVDPMHHDIEVAAFGRGGAASLSVATQLMERTVAVQGELVGSWGYDPTTATSEFHPFGKASKKLTAEVSKEMAAADATFEALGHARTICLDKDSALQKRLDRMRSR